MNCTCGDDWKQHTVFSDGSDPFPRYKARGRWHKMKCALFLVTDSDIDNARAKVRHAERELREVETRLAAQ